ncbi:hypothetical protein N8964_01375 [Pontimonas sp.]|nr:hypothetical protein [Pontimonas sp.]
MTIVSISAGASDNPGSGHWYWLYKYLFQTQNARGDSNGVTLGPIKFASDHLVGVFKIRASTNRQFARWSLFARDYLVLTQSVKTLTRSGVSRFQFYDGWLIELLLALQLAQKFPHARYLYNFHFALEWVQVFEGRGKAQRFLRRSVIRALEKKPSNLILTAETQQLAQLLSADVTHEIHDYPVLAAFDIPITVDWGSRKHDVLIFPHASDELPFSISLLSLLKEAGLQSRIVCSERAWARSASVIADKLSDDKISELPDPIYTPLAEGSYQELLSSSRIIILPYQDEYFRWGSSGKFNEAVAVGAFPFVPHTTAIATQSSAEPAIHFYPDNDPHEAVVKILKRLELGWDERLQPVTIDDLEKTFSAESTAIFAGRGELYRRLLSLTLASVIYSTSRYQPSMSKMRRAVGSFIDRRVFLPLGILPPKKSLSRL